MLLLSITPGVCLVWNKVLPWQCSPCFALSLTTPALLFIIGKREGKKASQFVVSIFHNEKLRCGSRGSVALNIQTNYVSTGGNRSQPLPLPLLHPRYQGPDTRTKLIYCASSAKFFSLHTEEMNFQRGSKALCPKDPHKKFTLLHHNSSANYQCNW